MDEKSKARQAYENSCTLKDAAREATKLVNDSGLSEREIVHQLLELQSEEFAAHRKYRNERAARKAAVAQRLQKVRKERGLMQKEVADQTGINVVTLSGYEIGKSEPNMEALVRLADVYGVSLDYLMCRTDEEAPQA